MMCILESIRAFFKKCPFLKSGPMGLDYLGSRPCGYTIDAIPAATVLERYVDCSARKQFVFVFASRETYATQKDNLENAQFYEQLADWLEEQNMAGTLPDLPEGKDALSLEASGGGYVMQTGAREARYQIQCKLEYFQGVIENGR